MKSIFFNLKKTYRQICAYPVLQISNTQGNYDAYWQDKRGVSIGALSPWQKQRAEILLKYLRQTAPASVIDIGCGDGSVLKYVQERVQLSRAIGVDVSTFALDKAKEFGVEVVLADINNLSSLEAVPPADYVLMFEILEHIQDSELFLESMLKKSHKGVFFSFPNTGFYTYRLRLLFGKFPLQWRIHPREHVRFWTYADLTWWLKALGYTHYEITTYQGVPFLRHVWPSMFAAGFFVYLKKSGE